MMKEIEVKFKVSDKTHVITALEKKGIKFGGEIRQDDTSYTPMRWVRGESSIGVPFLRIRREHDKTFLTLKKPVSNQLDRIEYEIEISDGEQARGIIEQLDFKKDVSIVKRRRKAQSNGYEICVDSVEKLGDFIEIEKIVEDDEDGLAVQKEIRDHLIGLLGGNAGLEEVDRGYDVLASEERDFEVTQ